MVFKFAELNCFWWGGLWVYMNKAVGVIYFPKTSFKASSSNPFTVLQPFTGAVYHLGFHEFYSLYTCKMMMVTNCHYQKETSSLLSRRILPLPLILQHFVRLSFEIMNSLCSQFVLHQNHSVYWLQNDNPSNSGSTNNLGKYN